MVANDSWQADFQRGYDLVSHIARDSLGQLPEELDEKLAGGHLLRVCLEHQQLTARASEGERSVASLSDVMCIYIYPCKPTSRHCSYQ